MPYINVDIDLEDVLADMSAKQLRTLCAELIQDGYGPDGAVYTELTSEPVQWQIHRIKTLGLDTELSNIEILERLLR